MGIVPELLIVIGTKSVTRTVGVIDNEDFDVLLGNDVTQELGMHINTNER